MWVLPVCVLNGIRSYILSISLQWVVEGEWPKLPKLLWCCPWKIIVIFTYKLSLLTWKPKDHHKHLTYDNLTNKHFWAYTWKLKLFSMSQGSVMWLTGHTWITWLRWDIYDKWQHEQQHTLLSLHMKTKVAQHGLRISDSSK